MLLGRAMVPEAPVRLAFGRCVLDPARESLAGPEGEIILRPKSFAVLQYLLNNAGRICSKRELLDTIWRQRVVTEDSLTQCLVEIRRALGDRQRTLVRTIARRGYLITEPVHVVPVDEAPDVNPVGMISHPGAALRNDGPSKQVANEAGDAHSPSGRLTYLVACSLALAAVLLVLGPKAGDIASPDLAPLADGVTLPAKGETVAILPFVDLSPQGEHAYLGYGIAEEILNRLASSDGLRVIARTSSFALHQQNLDIPSLARRLGATHVVEGSVRVDGKHLRLTAQLVDGRDGAHVWSQRYDRPLEDILSMQDDIAMQLAARMHASVAMRDAGLPTVDAQALEHRLLGSYLFARRFEGDLEAARAHFEAAVAKAPDYAEAWVGLAGTRRVLMEADNTIDPAELRDYTEASLRAVELAPTLPEAHLRAQTAYRLAGDRERAERHLETAVALDPENPLLLGMLAGRAMVMGDLDAAIAFEYRSLRRDPLSQVSRHNLTHYLLAANRISEARQEFDKLAELGTQDTVLEASLLLKEARSEQAWSLLATQHDSATLAARAAMALQALGRESEAHTLIDRVRTLSSPDAALAIAEYESWRDNRDVALAWLGEARARHLRPGETATCMLWREQIMMSPFLEPLRSHPDFGELMIAVR